MTISEVHLTHFRLYRQAEIYLAPGVNVIYGENAQGKSSLLEAIWFLSSGEALAEVGQLVLDGEVRAEVEARVEGLPRAVQVKAIIERGSSARYYIDRFPAKVSELYRVCPTVAFWPTDVVLISGEPERRRRFLDCAIARVRQGYSQYLRRYRRAVSQRNVCLRRGHLQALEVWEEEMASSAVFVVRERQEFVTRLAEAAEEIYRGISGNREKMSLEYRPSWIGSQESDIRQSLLEALERRRRQDARIGQTSVGPHRDDLVIRLAGREARRRGSRGQQREAALTLRLSQAEVVASILGREPVLLLDDVFSELDTARRSWLAEFLSQRSQVLVTTSEPQLIPVSLRAAVFWEVREGRIARGGL